MIKEAIVLYKILQRIKKNIVFFAKVNILNGIIVSSSFTVLFSVTVVLLCALYNLDHIYAFNTLNNI